MFRAKGLNESLIEDHQLPNRSSPPRLLDENRLPHDDPRHSHRHCWPDDDEHPHIDGLIADPERLPGLQQELDAELKDGVDHKCTVSPSSLNIGGLPTRLVPYDATRCARQQAT
jgi:hypothetical protein